MVTVEPARVEWLETLLDGDVAFTDRFGIPVAEGWAGFPEAVPAALEGTRSDPTSPWGTHLFFEAGTLVGFGGWKGPPVDGAVELGYAVAPSHQGRGVATAVVRELVSRAVGSGAVVTVHAHTLPESSPSTGVLRRCGFVLAGVVGDPDEGEVWRWELDLAADPPPRP